MSDPYDMIDRFLRNSLHDDDYAEFSAALDSLCSAQPAQAVPVLTDEEIKVEIRSRGQMVNGVKGDGFMQGARWAERAVRAKLGVSSDVQNKLNFCKECGSKINKQIPVLLKGE